MATTWNEENLGSSAWKDSNPGYQLVEEDGRTLFVQEDGETGFAQEGIDTSWGEISLSESTWSYDGFLIYLATEGLRDLIMTENDDYYIVIRKPGDWAEVNVGSAAWTEQLIV